MAKKNKRKEPSWNRSKKRIPQWIGAAMGIFPYLISFGLLGCLVGGSYAFAVSSELFCLDKLIVSGRVMDEADRFRFAGLRRGEPMLSIRLDDIEGRIRRYFPEYQRIQVRRNLPNEIRIDLIERLPVARLRLDREVLIDETGVVLADAPASGEPVPLILGVPEPDESVTKGVRIQFRPLEQAIKLIGEVSARNILKNHRLTVCDISDPRNVILRIDDSIDIRMGSRNLSDKLRKLADAVEIDDLNIDPKKVRYIDLRFDDIIIGPR
ncbi:MAG: cell division protein FtsQ/DivIB [Candidatus Omnitrophica bacterium]|nr:cell division protein FtsQ/DivIB [Candidatus Omnitrophota bacterium]